MQKTKQMPLVLAAAMVTIAAAVGAVGTAVAADPTRPAAAMADVMRRRLADSPALRLQALVVGTSGEGVALVGETPAKATAVRKGSVLTRLADGVSVDVPIRSVSCKGVEIGLDGGAASLYVAGSYAPLVLPTNPPPEFVRYLESANVPLGTVVRLIADQTGVNIAASDATADKNVSILLRNVTADAAVEEICRAAGLWFRREPGGNVIRVTTMKEYADNLGSFREERTETFTLLYPNVIEVASVIYGLYPDRTMLSLGEEEFDEDAEYDLARRFRRFRVIEENGNSSFMNMEPPRSSSSGSRSGSGMFSFSRGSALSRMTQWDQLRNRRNRSGTYDAPALMAKDAKQIETAYRGGDTNGYERAYGRSLIEPNIFITLSRKNNVLAVRTSDVRVMDEIRKMVKQLDVPTPMVLMEVKVLELDITDDYQADFSWNLTDIVDEWEEREDDNGNTVMTKTGNKQRITGTSSHAIGHDLYGAANLTAAAKSGLSGMNPTFAFGVIGDRIMAQIQLMQKDGRVKTLATPTLLSANNEVARIFSGMEYPLVTGWTKGETVSTLSGGATSEPTVEIEKKDVGTMLLITPNINSDKTVTLRLLQENSSVADSKASIPINGSNGLEKEIEYVESRSLTGTFVAKDGSTVMAGGLVREHDEETYWRTPVLGSIPYIGWLFRGTNKEKRRTELIVLIRPYVISTPYEGGKISSELLKALSAHPASDGRSAMGIFKDGNTSRAREHSVKDDVLNLVK